MANIVYRITSATPQRVAPVVKNLALTYEDLDGNFKVIDDELAIKANQTNAVLTGVPVAPTAAGGTNTTQIATTEFVQQTTTLARVAAGDDAIAFSIALG